MFNLHLKECEFRFNNRKQNIYRILLAIFRKEPLKLSWPKCYNTILYLPWGWHGFDEELDLKWVGISSCSKLEPLNSTLATTLKNLQAGCSINFKKLSEVLGW